MEHFWIVLAVLGAALQAIRTAAQRDLNKHLSTLATTYVRSLFGLPLLAVYLGAVMWATGEGVPVFGWRYLAYTLIGAMAQVVATMLLIRMFTLRSFGVGTMLTKVDIVFTAILGALLFSETLSGGGVVALGVVMAGGVLMSLERTGVPGLASSAAETGGWRMWLRSILADKALAVALGCAVSFAFSFLTYREAALVIGEGTFLWRGAWTVLLAILMQTVIVGGWLAWRGHPAAKLMLVVPFTLLIIFLLLYLNFGRLTETLIVMLSVPFALVGGLWLMYWLGFNFSVAVAVGFIALAGVAAETGVVMLIYLDGAYRARATLAAVEGRAMETGDVNTAVMEGAVERVRPKLMTVTAIMAGLLPIMWSTGAGSEIMQRIAVPMIGGMASSTVLTLVVIPAIYSLVKGVALKRTLAATDLRQVNDSGRME